MCDIIHEQIAPQRSMCIDMTKKRMSHTVGFAC